MTVRHLRLVLEEGRRQPARRLPLKKKRLTNHFPRRTWGPSRWGGACLVGRISPFEGRFSGPPRRGCDHDPVLLLLLLKGERLVL